MGTVVYFPRQAVVSHDADGSPAINTQSDSSRRSLTTSTYGAKVTYEVEVGAGGQILLSWLKSRFNNLGEARVTLDNQKPGIKIDGHWE